MNYTLTPTVTIFENADALGVQLANELAAQIVAARKRGAEFVLGCPAGRSLQSTYQALAKIIADRRLNLSHVRLVMMDEYVRRSTDSLFEYISLKDHCSCRGFAYRVAASLNAGLRIEYHIRPENVWFPDPRAPERYDDSIARAGGIDVFLLASGASDGHVAFNPPGSAVDSKTRIVALAETTRRDNLATFAGYSSLEEVPRLGVTVGLGTIAKLSRRTVLVMHGLSKANSAKRVLNGVGFDASWPVTIVCASNAPRILLDRSAASQIGDHHV
jgi:glucosamine-6-phosphate deaminase